tara:strand:+ start:800 stop:1186 length:387 start_codon:yes stop_codon:yes gene_type:complete
MSEKVLNKIKEWLQNNVNNGNFPLDRDSQALLDYIEEWENEDTPKEKVVINRNARPSVYFDGKEYHTIYHEYYGDNAYDKRKAVVFRKNDSYGVVMIDDGKIIEERLLKGHSEEYAEDCAENFVVGVI